MGEETRRVAIPVTGMTCAVCAERVEKALSKVVGVSGVGVNFPLHLSGRRPIQGLGTV